MHCLCSSPEYLLTIVSMNVEGNYKAFRAAPDFFQHHKVSTGCECLKGEKCRVSWCSRTLLFLAAQAWAVRSCSRVFMLPGFRFATSLSVFCNSIFVFGLRPTSLTWVMMFCSAKFYPSLILSFQFLFVIVLQMMESGWNGNFSLHTFTEESKKVVLPLC